MVADAEVFNPGMPSLVFSELVRSIIVAIKRGRIEHGHIEAIKELAEKEDFVGGIVDGDIFRITRSQQHAVVCVKPKRPYLSQK